jgi:N-acetyl-anhydromuramyl-L-alanine amidase AmpD
MGNLTPGAYTIDTFTYSKEASLERGQGWDLRPPGAVIDAIVLHSTNGAGVNFNAESVYLRDSEEVSTHYTVGIAGQIGRVLDPKYRAWVNGISRYDEALFWPGRTPPSPYNGRVAWNNFAIGIELVHKVGTSYPAPQMAALRWLVNELRANYPHIRKEGITLHRWISGPNVRTTDIKVDPSDLPDNWWRNWIISL